MDLATQVQPIRHGSAAKNSAWKALQHHYRKVRSLHLRELFGEDPGRGVRMACEGAGLYLDFSKNRITDQTLKLLLQLAEESGLHGRIDAMFRGEKINITQDRPALHVALRVPRGASILVDDTNVVPQVHGVFDRMSHFCSTVRNGDWKGATGKRIRNVINIGVGGCDVGPAAVYEALKDYSDRTMMFRFVSNLDGSDFREATRDLDPSETLFIVCSVGSAPREIIQNVRSAREWLVAGVGEGHKSLRQHFVAVSTSPDLAVTVGVDAATTFTVWEWVGEAYSVDSAVGLSTMLAIGPEKFHAMLDGFHAMDMHFLAAPFERNLPVLLGLLALWYINFFAVDAMAVLPYSHYLRRLPAYLQHLAMKSNGKHVTMIGTEVTHATAPLYWGEPGTNSQFLFHQLLHQGTRLVPCDFILFEKPLVETAYDHDAVVASALAQAESLAFGHTGDQLKNAGFPDWLVPHLEALGNRPSNTIFAPQLTPETLGKLLALYEHSLFTQGAIWNINSFDAWGVEVPRATVERILPQLADPEEPQLGHDGSTNALIRRYRRMKSCTQTAECSEPALQGLT